MSVEQWVTTGTPGGSSMVSGISDLFYSGSYVYFSADDGSGSGSLLWRTDGTAAGTTELSRSYNGGSAANLTAVGGNIFFMGADSVHGSGLFIVNGETGAVTFVAAVFSASHFTAVGSTLFFQASDGDNGSELWSSDGTATGTGIVKDFIPGGDGSGNRIPTLG